MSITIPMARVWKTDGKRVCMYATPGISLEISKRRPSPTAETLRGVHGHEPSLVSVSP